MDRILELHLVNPHGRVSPFPTVLNHVLANAGTQLFDEAQRSIVGNRQVSCFPPGSSSVRRFEREEENTY